MRNRDGISEYPGGSIKILTFVIAAMVVLFVTMLFAAPAQSSESVDDSVNDSFNFDLNIDARSQECNVIVEQFNGAISGNAAATNEAVASTAAAVDAPVNVVQSCLQARGSIGEGSLDDDGNDTEAASDGQEDTDDGAVQNDSTSAAQEQYQSDSTSTGQDDSCAVALDPKVTVEENAEASANLNVESGQEGDYRISYDLGGEEETSLDISITSLDSNRATSPINVSEDGSRIVNLNAASYTVKVTPTPPAAGYTVEVSRCGASSDNSGNTMDNTYDSGKQLANTGGATETASFASASGFLIPLGVALVISGVIAAFWLRNASNRG